MIIFGEQLFTQKKYVYLGNLVAVTDDDFPR